MALKKSPGPGKPADLIRKPAPPVSRKKASSEKSAATSSGGAGASDEGCTCGAEVGKQLEALEAADAPQKKAEKDYQ